MADTSSTNTSTSNQDPAANGSGESQTVDYAEYQKAVERARRFEGQLKDTEVKLKDFEKKYGGVDVEKWNEMQSKLEEAERKAAENDPKKTEEYHERKRAKERDDYEQKLKERDERLTRQEKELKTLKVTDKVMSEIGSLFVDGKGRKFIRQEIESRCDLDEDGQLVVKDENGDVMYRGHRPLTVKEFGQLLQEEFPELCKPTGTTGSKDMTSGSKVPPRGTKDYSNITYDEFVQMPNNREVWKQLSAEKKMEFAGRMQIGGVRN